MMKAAVAQLAPVFLDRDATLAKVADAVAEAARNGAGLVAFGETLAPAYPVWLSRTGGARFDAPDQKALHARYVDQGVTPAHLAPLQQLARTHEISVVLGVAERSAERGGTLYCSRVFIDARGQLASVHRKLMPTHEERLAWGIGDGAGLRTHRVGPFRVGALNCWENWMPLARAALYADGEDVHVMLWPGARRLTHDITRFVAKELRGYVLSASNLIRLRDLPDDLRARMGEAPTGYDGGSCIAGPDGRFLVEPFTDAEGICYADLDEAAVHAERQNFSPAGHYARPDVLQLSVDRRRQRTATFRDD